MARMMITNLCPANTPARDMIDRVSILPKGNDVPSDLFCVRDVQVSEEMGGDEGTTTSSMFDERTIKFVQPTVGTIR